MVFYKFRRTAINKWNRFFKIKFYFVGKFKFELLLYDDIFPHPLSGFRYEEFKELLREFNHSKIIVDPLSYAVVKTDVSIHKEHVNSIQNSFSFLKGKIKTHNLVNVNAKLFYCVFLNNIYKNINWIEKYNIPFVFTLYPGGGFTIENESSDQKLEKIFKSSLFRKVIVTQLYTKNYLINKGFCTRDKIEYIFGGVVPQHSLTKSIEQKKFYPEKNTFDVLFCAAKYMPEGKDKGYDVFIELAHRLKKKFDFVRFHIVGGFDENDIDVSSLDNKATFYGYKDYEDLAPIFKKMDIVISPNKPFLLNKGAFDGFPLGAVVEAVLNGVVALVTDNLNQNTEFENGKELFIIDNDLSATEKVLIDLLNQPEKLRAISQNGRAKFLKIYSNEYQMQPRIKILRDEIKKK